MDQNPAMDNYNPGDFIMIVPKEVYEYYENNPDERPAWFACYVETCIKRRAWKLKLDDLVEHGITTVGISPIIYKGA